MDTLQFGSRSASCIALAFFSAVFLVLAVAVWREIRKRAPARRRTAAAASAVVFIAPVALIYTSSLGGFYEAEVRDGRVVLRYLFPTSSELPLADVETVRAAPAFKGRWRLRVIAAGGGQYESATADRDVVNGAAQRLRQAVRDR